MTIELIQFIYKYVMFLNKIQIDQSGKLGYDEFKKLWSDLRVWKVSIENFEYLKFYMHIYVSCTVNVSRQDWRKAIFIIIYMNLYSMFVSPWYHLLWNIWYTLSLNSYNLQLLYCRKSKNIHSWTFSLTIW